MDDRGQNPVLGERIAGLERDSLHLQKQMEKLVTAADLRGFEGEVRRHTAQDIRDEVAPIKNDISELSRKFDRQVTTLHAAIAEATKQVEKSGLDWAKIAVGLAPTLMLILYYAVAGGSPPIEISP